MSDLQIPKSLLIIKVSKTSLITAEQFLKNRDWSVISTISLKDALTYVVQHKPKFVMVCVDHPNKKIRTLPKLLSQAFPVCVITYAEQSTSQSYRLLMDSHSDYKVNPPVTGPAIERAVNKYIRDQEKAALAPKDVKPQQGAGNQSASPNSDGRIQVKGAQGSDVITFKGEQGQTDGAFNLENMNKILGSMEEEEEGGDSSGPAYMPSSSGQSGSGIMGSGGVGSGPAYSGNQGQSPNTAQGAGYMPESSTENPKEGQLIDLTKQPQKDPSGRTAQATVYKEDEDLRTPMDPSKAPGMMGGSAGKKNNNGMSGGLPEEDSNGNSSFGQAPGAIRAREIDESPLPVKNPEAFTQPIRGPRASIDTESIIVKGSNQALEESVEIHDGKVKENLNDNTNVACILIESTRFSGYLVTAMGKNRKIDNHFIKTIQERLFNFLKANGEDLSDKENMQMKIKKVDFEDWALEYAEFLRKSVHKGDEVAMAFFPRQDAAVQVKESASEEMGAVSINEIAPDKPVECNLYVYLPANNKYVLYTPKGGTFYGAQKDRLEKQGVKELHILKAEAQDMTKYKAQNYLNNLIDDFQNNQKNKNQKSTGT